MNSGCLGRLISLTAWLSYPGSMLAWESLGVCLVLVVVSLRATLLLGMLEASENILLPTMLIR